MLSFLGSPISRFDGSHLFLKVRAIPLNAAAEMCAPVAVRAKRNHMSRVIRSAVRNPSNVMWFEVGCTTRPQERRRCGAVFAASLRSSEHVVANIRGSLIYRARRFLARDRRFSSSVSASSKGADITDRGRWKRFFSEVYDCVERAQLKYNCFSLFLLAVEPVFIMPTLADHLVFEDDVPSWVRFLEKQQRFTVNEMVCDRFVAAGKRHVAILALTKIFNKTVGVLSVVVTVFESAFATDNENDGVFRRRYNTTLPLATELGVNVFAAIVCRAALKAECHCVPPNVRLNGFQHASLIPAKWGSCE